MVVSKKIVCKDFKVALELTGNCCEIEYICGNCKKANNDIICQESSSVCKYCHAINAIPDLEKE